MLRIGAVVLNFRRWPSTREVLVALREQTLPPVALVIVDNGSGADEARAIARDEPGRLLALPVNGGYAAGMNAGAAHIGRLGVDALLLLTHDCILERTCLESLARELEQDDRVAITAPVLVWRGNDRLWSAGGRIKGWSGFPEHYGKGASVGLRHVSRDVDWVDGAAMLVRQEAFLTVGGFREDYFLYFEEVDLATRLGRQGWRVRVAGDAMASQRPGTTPPYLALRNHVLFVRRNRPLRLPGAIWVALTEVARQAWRVTRGRAPYSSFRVAALGLADGLSGRLRMSLVDNDARPT